MLIPETAIVYRQMNFIQSIFGGLFTLFARFVTFQRETHRFRSILIRAGLTRPISGPVMYSACFIDLVINSVIARIMLMPDEHYSLGGFFAGFPYVFFSIFTIFFVCLDQSVAYQRIHGTVYILVINCLSIVLDSASKSLLSELFYLKFGFGMFLPFTLCFCGNLVWRTILRAFIVAFAQSDTERIELFEKNFAYDPAKLKINTSFARGFIFAASYSILRPILGSTVSQYFCAIADCCNIVLLVTCFIRQGTYEVDDMYATALYYMYRQCKNIGKLGNLSGYGKMPLIISLREPHA